MIPALCDEQDEDRFSVARVISSSLWGRWLFSFVGPDAAHWRGINGWKAFRDAIGTKHCEWLTLT